MASPLNSLVDASVLRFGPFELDLAAESLYRDGRTVRLQPKPFKLLCLLAGQPGRLVTRDEIRLALWERDTFVDFEQGVNFAIKQVREALGEDAERPVFVQTVPRRGYKFIAPVASVAAAPPDPGRPVTETNLELQKLLWIHIADLKLAEHRRQKRWRLFLIVLGIGGFAAAVVLLAATFLR